MASPELAHWLTRWQAEDAKTCPTFHSPTQPRSQCRGFSLFIPLAFCRVQISMPRLYRSNSSLLEFLRATAHFFGEESIHARYGVADRIFVCVFGGHPRPVDQSVVTAACLGFEEQSVRIWNSWNKP